ncbi:MAG: MFS transporter [Spirochaetaceae bacterium]|jgi:predicted MFS family arabinose efflux permease|nr:MFS transporter [Spirochaetaceae bacterium]
MNKNKVRRILFFGSTLITAIVLGFLWILNINQSAELKETFLIYIIVLWLCSTAALALFYFKGILFKITGGLERNRILMITVMMLFIVQLAFAFATYAYYEMRFAILSYENAQKLFKSIGWNTSERIDNTKIKLPEEFDQIYIIDSTGNVEYVMPPINEGSVTQYLHTERYLFPLDNGRMLGMHISKVYHDERIRKIILDLFTVMVVSLFFGFELVLFLIRFIEVKIALAPHSEPPIERIRRPPDHCINFIRQISFLFYFASRMSAAFIPVLATKLAEKSFGKTLAAGIPQSTETFLTCVAILITSNLIIKKGWKHSYITGIFFVIAGNLLSAFTTSFIIFTAARAIVGLGYGFCWMTLRNISLFGMNEQERSWGFMMLNAGIYAGTNSGQVVGSILAETLNYKTVLIITGCVTAISAIMVLFIKNDKLPAPEPKPSNEKDNNMSSSIYSPFMQILLIILFLVIPSCITGGYSDFFVPVYVINAGKDISDAGRALLLYGLVIVYAGPKMAQICRERLGNGLRVNVCYNIFLALAMIIPGFFMSYNALVISILVVAFAEAFCLSAQNDFFLSLPFMSKMPSSKAFSLMSLMKKLSAMLGPIIFAFGLSFPNNQGTLIIGICVLTAAIFSVTITSTIKENKR